MVTVVCSPGARVAAAVPGSGAPLMVKGAEGAMTLVIVTGALPSLEKVTVSVTWPPIAVPSIDTSEVLASSSGESAWPVPLTEKATGPASVANVISPPTRPVCVGENVTGTLMDWPWTSCAGNAGDGVPTANVGEEVVMLGTFHG